jgi:hypothetical protein
MIRRATNEWGQRTAMVVESVKGDERENGEERTVRAVGVAEVVVVAPGIVVPTVVGRRGPGCFSGSGVGVNDRFAGTRRHTDDGETGPPFVPRNLHAENGRRPTRIIDAGLIAAYVTLVEQELNEGIDDAVQFRLRQGTLVVGRDNRVGLQWPYAYLARRR